jgi:outer membrane protein
MHRTRIALLAALVTCFTAAGAFAQAAKIGIVNPGSVFAKMQETTDLKSKLENDRKALESEVNQRQQAVKDLQAARDLLKPDSPQYQEADQKFMKAAIEFDTWSKITQAQLQGQQKQQMKTLFDKIVASTTRVAQAKGFDLVIADQRPEDGNINQMTVEQLRNNLNGRNILFSAANAVLDNDVIADLDAAYKASGPPASSPAPAPTPTPAK